MQSIWLPALTGGLAGATLTLLMQAFARWLTRPRLVVEFSDVVPGCVVNNSWKANDESGHVVDREENYVRIKIANNGRSFARNVCVCLTSMKHSGAAIGERIFSEEVLELKLALTEDQRIFNLASGAHRFIDLGYTTNGSGISGLVFDFEKKVLNRIRNWQFTRGKYDFEVFASAENAPSISRPISLRWDGTVRGIKMP